MAAMPRPYSEDLRWLAIWIIEFSGYSVDDFPQYLLRLSSALLRFFPTTFLETAVHKRRFPKCLGFYHDCLRVGRGPRGPRANKVVVVVVVNQANVNV